MRCPVLKGVFPAIDMSRCEGFARQFARLCNQLTQERTEVYVYCLFAQFVALETDPPRPGRVIALTGRNIAHSCNSPTTFWDVPIELSGSAQLAGKIDYTFRRN